MRAADASQSEDSPCRINRMGALIGMWGRGEGGTKRRALFVSAALRRQPQQAETDQQSGAGFRDEADERVVDLRAPVDSQAVEEDRTDSIDTNLEKPHISSYDEVQRCMVVTTRDRVSIDPQIEGSIAAGRGKDFYALEEPDRTIRLNR